MTTRNGSRPPVVIVGGAGCSPFTGLFAARAFSPRRVQVTQLGRRGATSLDAGLLTQGLIATGILSGEIAAACGELSDSTGTSSSSSPR